MGTTYPSPSTRYDLIILGNGISGLIAAIEANKADMKICFVRLFRRRRSAHLLSLHPGCEGILKELGLDLDESLEDMSRPDGYLIKTGHSTQFQPYSPNTEETWHGFLLSQADLIEQLDRRLSEFDVSECLPKSIELLTDRQGRVRGACLDGLVIEADHLIDATGPRQILARQKGLKKRFGSPRLIAELCVSHKDCRSQYATFTAAQGEWTWQANTKMGPPHRVSLPLNGPIKSRRCPDMTYADVTWTHVPDCAGPGYSIVGDAALRIDPAAGNGFLRAAMMSAVAVKHHQKQNRVQSYRDWVGHWARSDATELSRRYASDDFKVEWAAKHSWSDEILTLGKSDPAPA